MLLKFPNSREKQAAAKLSEPGRRDLRLQLQLDI